MIGAVDLTVLVVEIDFLGVTDFFAATIWVDLAFVLDDGVLDFMYRWTWHL